MTFDCVPLRGQCWLAGAKRLQPALDEVWAHNRMSLSNNYGQPHTLCVPPTKLICAIVLVPALAAQLFNSHIRHYNHIKEAAIFYLLFADGVPSISLASLFEHHFLHLAKIDIEKKRNFCFSCQPNQKPEKKWGHLA